MSSLDGLLPRLRGGAAGNVLYLKVEDWRCFRVGFESGCSIGLVEVVRRGARGRTSSSVAVVCDMLRGYVSIYRAKDQA